MTMKYDIQSELLYKLIAKLEELISYTHVVIIDKNNEHISNLRSEIASLKAEVEGEKDVINYLKQHNNG